MTLVTLGLGVTLASAFVNNTPLVVVMLPIFMQLAKQLQMSPSKLLIPLSYMTILGGTVTMIGTSTNLVVDGVGLANIVASRYATVTAAAQVQPHAQQQVLQALQQLT